jgi:translation initiation factor 4G
LNKICPENVETIAKRIKDEAKPETIPEIELVVELVFKKALAEPHYCETYANMVFMLKGEMPSFPNPDGGNDVTFKSILLNVCQNEFENMPRKIEISDEDRKNCDAEELKFKMATQKARFLANMRFIGHLFLQKLLNSKIVASIISELVGLQNDEEEIVPEEHVVECICELLTAIGHTLEGMPAGKECITQVCGRLLELKGRLKDGKGLLSKRIQFSIQDVLEMRQKGWMKKTFKAVAKTKEEVRAQHEEELEAQKRGKNVTGAELVVAGARPTHLQPEKSQGDGNWEVADKKKGRR